MLLDKPCGNICCKAFDTSKKSNCSISSHTGIIGECEDYFEDLHTENVRVDGFVKE